MHGGGIYLMVKSYLTIKLPLYHKHVVRDGQNVITVISHAIATQLNQVQQVDDSITVQVILYSAPEVCGNQLLQFLK